MDQRSRKLLIVIIFIQTLANGWNYVIYKALFYTEMYTVLLYLHCRDVVGTTYLEIYVIHTVREARE